MHELPRFFLLLVRALLHFRRVQRREGVPPRDNITHQSRQPEMERSSLNRNDVGKCLDPRAVQLPSVQSSRTVRK
jgi:hypothetical protein